MLAAAWASRMTNSASGWAASLASTSSSLSRRSIAPARTCSYGSRRQQVAQSTGSWIPRWIRVPFRTTEPSDVVDVLIQALQALKANGREEVRA